MRDNLVPLSRRECTQGVKVRGSEEERRRRERGKRSAVSAAKTVITQLEKVQRRVSALLDGNETSVTDERAQGEFLNSRLFVTRLHSDRINSRYLATIYYQLIIFERNPVSHFFLLII